MKVVKLVLIFLASAGAAWWLPGSIEDSEEKDEVLRSGRVIRAGDMGGGTGRSQFRELEKISDAGERLRWVVALASSIPVEEIAGLYESGILNSLDDRLEKIFREIALERWLEAVPVAMMKWSMVTEVGNFELYAAKWAIRDSEALMRFVNELPVAGRPGLMRGLFGELVRLDPDQAMALAKDQFVGNVDGFDESVDGIAYQLARHNLEEFLQLREGWAPDLRESTKSAVASVLLQRDFAEGLEFLKSDEKGWDALSGAMSLDIDGGLFRELLEKIGEVPEGWMEEILVRPRWRMPGGIQLDWLELDAAAFGVSEAVFEEFARQASGGMPGTMSYFDEGQRKRVMDLVNGPSLDLVTRRSLLRDQIQWWPGWEDDKVGAWLGELKDEALFDTADRMLAWKEARKQSGQLDKPQERIRKIAAGEVAGFSSGYWSAEEIRETNRVFRDLSAEEKGKAVQFFENDPLMTSYWPSEFRGVMVQEVLEEGGDTYKLVGHFSEFVSEWARKEPAKVATWSESLPEGERRLDAVRAVAEQWADYSVEEVAAWGDTLPAEEKAVVRALLESGE